MLMINAYISWMKLSDNMKKILIIGLLTAMFVAALLLSSCKKEEILQPQLTTKEMMLGTWDQEDTTIDRTHRFIQIFYSNDSAVIRTMDPGFMLPIILKWYVTEGGFNTVFVRDGDSSTSTNKYIIDTLTDTKFVYHHVAFQDSVGYKIRMKKIY